MALIRIPKEANQSVNYLATIALFACVSCLIVMLKFGFKATINFYGRRKKEDDELTSMAGAYRMNRDDYFDSDGVVEPRKKLTPSMVQLPPSAQTNAPLRPAKSTSDLMVPNNSSVQLNKSMNDVSYDPRGGPPTTSNRNTTIVDERKLNSNKDNQQAKLDKKRLDEQKTREKMAAKEQEKQDKLRKKREKEEARAQAKLAKENAKKKRPAPQPKATAPSKNPTAQVAPLANPTTSNASNNRQGSATPSNVPKNTPARPQTEVSPAPQAAYSSNTLQSSISRSSGPPPYSEVTTPEIPKGINVSFGKPIEEPPNSWDMISQHRQQMSRPVGQTMPKGPKKNMVMDLQYKLGNDDNSEA